MTGRRKGTPCGCDADPCGCSPKNQCIKTINGQYPDANHEFEINAGDGIIIDPDGNGIRIGMHLASPMIYRGTVGTGGTIGSLPQANADNLGWTYVAVTPGSTPDTPPENYSAGDMLISNGVVWTVVPAGDDPVDWSQIQNKPTTVAGYGITDAVDIGSSQSITGAKNFTSRIITNDYVQSLRLRITNPNVEYNVQPSAYAESSLQFMDKNNQFNGAINWSQLANDDTKAVDINIRDKNGNWMTRNFKVIKNPNYECVVAPSRAYASANTTDVVTIGSLAANPSVVHTTGNENIGGTKRFNEVIQRQTSIPKQSNTNQIGSGVQFYASDGTRLGNLYIQRLVDGKLTINMELLNSDGTTYSYIALGTST